MLLNLTGGSSVEDLKILEADKGFKSYQPLNTWWDEHGIILHTQFRDGNVPAGFDQLKVFKKALACLPESVKKVKLRSDTAGYQHGLLKYGDKTDNKRFGKIEFAIGCNVSKAFKTAVEQILDSRWHPIYKDHNDEEPGISSLHGQQTHESNQIFNDSYPVQNYKAFPQPVFTVVKNYPPYNIWVEARRRIAMLQGVWAPSG